MVRDLYFLAYVTEILNAESHIIGLSLEGHSLLSSIKLCSSIRSHMDE